MYISTPYLGSSSACNFKMPKAEQSKIAFKQNVSSIDIETLIKEKNKQMRDDVRKVFSGDLKTEHLDIYNNDTDRMGLFNAIIDVADEEIEQHSGKSIIVDLEEFAPTVRELRKNSTKQAIKTNLADRFLVPYLTRAKNKDNDAVALALDALARIGERKHVDIVFPYATDNKYYKRSGYFNIPMHAETAISLLSNKGDVEDKDVINKLVKNLNSKHIHAKELSLRLLGNVAKPGNEKIIALIKPYINYNNAEKNLEDSIRIAARGSLGKLVNDGNQEIIDSVLLDFCDQPTKVKMASMETVGAIVQNATEPLVSRVNTSDVIYEPKPKVQEIKYKGNDVLWSLDEWLRKSEKAISPKNLTIYKITTVLDAKGPDKNMLEGKAIKTLAIIGRNSNNGDATDKLLTLIRREYQKAFPTNEGTKSMFKAITIGTKGSIECEAFKALRIINPDTFENLMTEIATRRKDICLQREDFSRKAMSREMISSNVKRLLYKIDPVIVANSVKSVR